MLQLLFKKNKKLLSLIIITAIILMPSTSYATSLSLNDISNHWAKDYINILVTKGIIDGYSDGSFRPDTSISRAEFVKILVASINLDKANESVFEDTVGHWANKYIGASLNAGIINTEEYDDLTFNPDGHLTRLEVAKMITRALGKEAETDSASIEKLCFTDINDLTKNEKGYVYVVNNEGIMVGYPDGRFGANNHLTRAEATVIITRMLDLNSQQSKTIAIYGTDERGSENSRSDIIMVLKLRQDTKQITVISIPRDTRVDIPGVKTDKINHAYAFGGADLLEETLEKVLNTDIDYYVKLSFENFKTIIDDLGGVEVISLKSFTSNDEEIIAAGQQTLTGGQALFYVRYRSDADGDFGRIKRQQEVVQSLTEKTLENMNLLMLPDLFRLYSENVESNLNFTDLLSNRDFFKDRDALTFDCHTLDTTSSTINGVWYELINEEDLDRLRKLLDE